MKNVKQDWEVDIINLIAETIVTATPNKDGNLSYNATPLLKKIKKLLSRERAKEQEQVIEELRQSLTSDYCDGNGQEVIYFDRVEKILDSLKTKL